MHPQPGGLGYRYWLGCVLGMTQEKKRIEPAKVVQYFMQSDRRKLGQYRLRAFGYDMDNMKARCWYEATFPLYDIADGRAQELVMAVASRAVISAEWVASGTRNALKDAWFGNGAEMRGNLSFVDAAFWSLTETAFYAGLAQAVTLAREGGEFNTTVGTREKWRQTLIDVSEQLFDERAASADFSIANPRRIAEAHKNLLKQLHGNKLKQLLALAPPDQKQTRQSKIAALAEVTGGVA